MSDERASSENKSWVQIVVALIGALAVILVGYWQFSRKPPDDNQRFEGRVVDENQLIWNAAAQPYIGIGIMKGNTLAVSWGNKKCGVASYQVKSDGSLDGKWAFFEQESMGKELLVSSSDTSTNRHLQQLLITAEQ
jgi:hypothetical protein